MVKSEPIANINISDDERSIMQIVSDTVGTTYVIENDLYNCIDGFTKALIRRTVRNDNILKIYKLERVTATKEIKEKFNIDSKGYPNIVKYIK